jgi:DNA-binding HxlR family transcriptional regulator
MYEAVDALTSRIGLGIMRELATEGPQTASELMTSLGLARRQTLLRTLYRLEEAGVVVADLPPDQRRGRTAVYSLVPEQVSRYFQQLEGFALGGEIEPPPSDV